MSGSITIFGLASKKIVKVISIPETYSENLSLMNFLIGNGITIASSCNGEGACHKCLINKTTLSCQITLKNYLAASTLRIVEISYL